MMHERSEPSEKTLRHLDADKKENLMNKDYNSASKRNLHGTMMSSNNNFGESETTFAAERRHASNTIEDSALQFIVP